MALISELNAVASEALTFPLPTVAMFSRVLREGGLISKKGRGRGAAHATPLDAARLLIALLATASPQLGRQCVADFGKLIISDRSEARLSPDAVKPAGFTLGETFGLPGRHTFEEALAAVIAGLANPEVASAHIDVAVFDTALSAVIAIGVHQYSYHFGPLVDCGTDRPILAAADELEATIAKYKRGIRSRREVGTEVLTKIAAVVNGQAVSK